MNICVGVMQLKLRKLDISSNRIAHIPLDLHKMTTMEELCLDNNPLLTPPSNVSIASDVHFEVSQCKASTLLPYVDS